jgi:hypothetical protein
VENSSISSLSAYLSGIGLHATLPFTYCFGATISVMRGMAVSPT